MMTAITWIVIAGILLLYGYSIYKNNIKTITLATVISVIALLATTSGAFAITTTLGLIVLLVMTTGRLIEPIDKHAVKK
jgi:chromate transport protein ChrA